MNWLAHIWLAGTEDPRERVGNLLPDLLRPREQGGLGAAFQRGMARHREIDARTDAHPATRATAQRFWGFNRRASMILADMFYDHVLASHWEEYSPVPLSVFCQGFYRDFGSVRDEVPEPARALLARIAREDWFGSYATPDGIHLALCRLEARLRFRVPLAGAIEVFAEVEAEIAKDFRQLSLTLRE